MVGDNQAIGAGIDSGPAFARERLKLQVESLQSSLKSVQRAGPAARHGAAPVGDAGGDLRALLALPALTDAATASRIDALLTGLVREGK